MFVTIEYAQLTAPSIHDKTPIFVVFPIFLSSYCTKIRYFDSTIYTITFINMFVTIIDPQLTVPN